MVEAVRLCKRSHYCNESIFKQAKINRFGMSSDEGTPRTLVGGHGITGSREDPSERHDMIIRLRAQLGAFVAGLQQLSHSCCDPMVHTSLETFPAEAAVHL